MSTNKMEYLGFVAAIFTTAAFLPQVFKTWREKETKDISLVMLIILTVGIILWLIYGLGIGDWPLIFANSITLFFVTILLFLKLKYK